MSPAGRDRSPRPGSHSSTVGHHRVIAGATEIGTLVSRSILSSISNLASHCSRPRNNVVSWPPTLATGTIGAAA